MQRAVDTKAGIDEQETKLRFAKIFINTALANAATSEFREAVDLLQKNTPTEEK